MEKITTWEWIFGTGIGLFLLKDVFWAKYKKNQERIDNSVIDTVGESKKRLSEFDLKLQAHDFAIEALKGNYEELKGAWKENNNSLRSLNETIKLLDSNARDQHREMKQLVGDNTAVMQQVVSMLKTKM